jgi:LysM repeat protein
MAHRRSPARWLAPLALITCAIAVYAVVNNTIGSPGGGETSAGERTVASPPASHRSKTRKQRPSAPTMYTVRSGDILSSIAEETGVPVERLRALNPGVDARALRVGQRLRLRS